MLKTGVRYTVSVYLCVYMYGRRNTVLQCRNDGTEDLL